MGIFQKKILIAGLLSAFFFVISALAVLQYHLANTLGTKIGKSLQDLATTFLAPPQDRLGMVIGDTQKEYINIMNSIEGRNIFGGIKDQVLNMNKTFYEKLVEMPTNVDPRLVWTVVISITIATATLAVQLGAPNPITEINEKVILLTIHKWKEWIEGKEFEKTDLELLDEAYGKAVKVESVPIKTEIAKHLEVMLEEIKEQKIFNEKFSIMDLVAGYLYHRSLNTAEASYLMSKDKYMDPNAENIYLKFEGVASAETSDNSPKIEVSILQDSIEKNKEHKVFVDYLTCGGVSHNEREYNQAIEHLEALIDQNEDIEEGSLLKEKLKEYNDTLRLRDRLRHDYETVRDIAEGTLSKANAAKARGILTQSQFEETKGNIDETIQITREKVVDVTVYVARLAKNLSNEILESGNGNAIFRELKAIYPGLKPNKLSPEEQALLLSQILQVYRDKKMLDFTLSDAIGVEKIKSETEGVVAILRVLDKDGEILTCVQKDYDKFFKNTLGVDVFEKYTGHKVNGKTHAEIVGVQQAEEKEEALQSAINKMDKKGVVMNNNNLVVESMPQDAKAKATSPFVDGTLPKEYQQFDPKKVASPAKDETELKPEDIKPVEAPSVKNEQTAPAKNVSFSNEDPGKKKSELTNLDPNDPDNKPVEQSGTFYSWFSNKTGGILKRSKKEMEKRAAKLKEDIDKAEQETKEALSRIEAIEKPVAEIDILKEQAKKLDDFMVQKEAYAEVMYSLLRGPVLKGRRPMLSNLLPYYTEKKTLVTFKVKLDQHDYEALITHGFTGISVFGRTGGVLRRLDEAKEGVYAPVTSAMKSGLEGITKRMEKFEQGVSSVKQSTGEAVGFYYLLLDNG